MERHIDNLDRYPVLFTVQVIFFGFVFFEAVRHTRRNRVAYLVMDVDLIARQIGDDFFTVRQTDRQIVPRNRVEIRHNRFESIKKFFRSHK